MRFLFVALPAIACALTSSPARADMITVTSSSFLLGVDVSDAFDGITLQRLELLPGARTYLPVSLPVITSEPFRGPLDVSFGAFDASFYNGCYTEGQGGNSSSFCSYFSVLEVTFDAPTNYVQIVGDFDPDGPGLEPILFAYASDGSVISGCGPFAGGPDCEVEFTPLPPVPRESERSTISFSRDQRDIARVVWGGFVGGAWAHQISYTVPEPSTWLLIGVGSVGLMRRRKRFSTSGPLLKSS